ncbi:WD40-repeat-containing domain [Pseudocohnilembus persalinus]|uniref:WD40-repeat-containing domain n=1 Tax=Pseudocohnilembus persalinus TaxID=266149 RepID=A0A0V0QVC4_PSEPJ|nr:WD40-repeat-containing domain [Pseudocohnilembus persalinus]|eukprot:KRX06329.1 WD40-repeat-containing domain [Pseudocohnilembus persalinus]
MYESNNNLFIRNQNQNSYIKEIISTGDSRQNSSQFYVQEINEDNGEKLQNEQFQNYNYVQRRTLQELGQSSDYEGNQQSKNQLRFIQPENKYQNKKTINQQNKNQNHINNNYNTLNNTLQMVQDLDNSSNLYKNQNQSRFPLICQQNTDFINYSNFDNYEDYYQQFQQKLKQQVNFDNEKLLQKNLASQEIIQDSDKRDSYDRYDLNKIGNNQQYLKSNFNRFSNLIQEDELQQIQMEQSKNFVKFDQIKQIQKDQLKENQDLKKKQEEENTDKLDKSGNFLMNNLSSSQKEKQINQFTMNLDFPQLQVQKKSSKQPSNNMGENSQDLIDINYDICSENIAINIENCDDSLKIPCLQNQNLNQEKYEKQQNFNNQQEKLKYNQQDQFPDIHSIQEEKQDSYYNQASNFKYNVSENSSYFDDFKKNQKQNQNQIMNKFLENQKVNKNRSQSNYTEDSFGSEKLIIFSGELLDNIQTIRNLPTNITTIATSSRYGHIFIFTQGNQIITYSPFLGGGLEYDQGQDDKIYWKKTHVQSLKFEAIDGYVSFDDQYLLTCGENQINIFRIEMDDFDEHQIKNFKHIFELSLQSNIKNVKFSMDSRSFAIRLENSNHLYVYDFVKILYEDKGFYNLEESALVENHILSHENEIITYKFRESIKGNDINQCPNTIISLDVNYTLRVWQESMIFNTLEQEDLNFTEKFFLLHSIDLQFPIPNLPSLANFTQVTCSFIYFQGEMSKADQEHHYDENSQNKKYGNNELDPYTSIDYIAVYHTNSQLKIYKVTGLRNYGKTSSIELIYEIQNKLFLNSLSRLSYIMQKEESNREILDIYGWDQLNNLVKVSQNLVQGNFFQNLKSGNSAQIMENSRLSMNKSLGNIRQSSFGNMGNQLLSKNSYSQQQQIQQQQSLQNQVPQVRVIYSSKYSYSKILHIAFDKISEVLAVFTLENQLIIQRNSIVNNLLPCQHNGFLKYKEQFILQYDSKGNDFKDISGVFMHNRIIFVFYKQLKTVSIIQISQDNQNILYQKEIEIEEMLSEVLGYSFENRNQDSSIFQLLQVNFSISKDQSQLTGYFGLRWENKFILFRIESDIYQEQEQEKQDENFYENKKITENLELEDEEQKIYIYVNVVNQYEFRENEKISQIFGFNEKEQDMKMLVFSQKLIKIYKLSDNQVSTVQEYHKDQLFIEKVQYLQTTPNLISIQTEDKQLHIMKENGELICKFYLQQFLTLVDKSLFDIKDVRMQLFHLYDKNFILQIENYIMLLNLKYDPQSQSHYLNFLKKSSQINQIYYLRLSRFSNPDSYQLFLTQKKDVILKTEEKIKFINSKFEQDVIEVSNLVQQKSVQDTDFLPSNIHTKILGSSQYVPHHHPQFWIEIISIGNFEGISVLIEKIFKCLREMGKVSSRFTLSFLTLKYLFSQDNAAAANPYVQKLLKKQREQDEKEHEENQFKKLKRRDSFRMTHNQISPELVCKYLQEKKPEQEEESEDTKNKVVEGEDVKKIIERKNQGNFLFEDGDEASDLCDEEKLLKIIQECPQCMGLNNQELQQLEIILEFLVFQKQNSRVLDYYSSMFLFHVKMAQYVKMKQKNRYFSLSSREMAFAVHSLQKETMIQETVDKVIQNSGPEALNWNLLKRYGVAMWYDDVNKLKGYIKTIAQQEYNEVRDPSKVALWYILSDQVKVLAFLFKSSTLPNGPKMAELLSNDFTVDKWRIAASKNADVLLTRKQYDYAAFFYLLGGLFNNAMHVIIDRMKDIQLGILACQLLDKDPEKKNLKRIVQTHLIDVGKLTNDPFLSHLGYYFIGQHIMSINTMYEYDFSKDHSIEFKEGNKKVCQDWPAKFEPDLSAFHPCIINFTSKLKDTIQVKREVQEQENKKRHVQTMAQEFNWDDFDDDQPQKQEEEEVETLQISEDQTLLFKFSLDNQIGDHDETYFLQNKLIKKHMQFLINDSIQEGDYKNLFSKLSLEMQQLHEYFDPQMSLQDMKLKCEKKILQLNSPKLTIAIELQGNKKKQALNVLKQLCIEIQSEVYIYGCDNYQYYWGNLIYALQELDSGLIYIQNSIKQNQEEVDEEFINDLRLIQFCRLFCEFVIALGLGVYENTFLIIDILQNFSANTVKNLSSSQLSQNLKGVQFLEEIPLTTYNSYFRKARLISTKKQKNNKAYQYQDMYREAFPISAYDPSFFSEEALKQKKMREKYEKSASNNGGTDLMADLEEYGKDSVDRGKIKLLEALFKYLDIKKFLQLSKNIVFQNSQQEKIGSEKQNYINLNLENLEGGNILKILQSFKMRQKKMFKRLITSYRLNEQVEILKEINDIVFVDKDKYQETKHFYYLDKTINPNTLVKLHLKIFRDMKNKICQEVVEQEKQNLLSKGLEIFKTQRGDIKNIMFQNFKNQFYHCVILTSSGFKHINIVNYLLNKTRTTDGFKILQEDQSISTFQENNLQKDKEQVINKKFRIHQNKPYILNLASQIFNNHDIPDNGILQRYQFNTLKTYQKKDLREMMKNASQKSSYNFSDLQCIVSHPNLPLYFTGGSRGTIDIWVNKSEKEFLSIKDTSSINIGELMLENQADSINSLKFNAFGDKLGGISNNGNIYLWKLSRSYKKSILSIQGQKLNDFAFINEGSVIAIVGDKQFTIIDTIMGKGKTVIQENFGGQALGLLPNKYVMLIINYKKNQVIYYDLKRNSVQNTYDLSNATPLLQQNNNLDSNQQSDKNQQQQITYSLVSKSEASICIGYENNLIRIFDTLEFRLVYECKPFAKRSDQKKNPSVIQLLEAQNALFAVSDQGTISLVYLALN